MKTRGRTSAAALEVVTVANVQRLARPGPPDDLTDEQSAEWQAIVSMLPAEWFPRETHAVLAEYCRHVVLARRVGQLIRQAESAQMLDVTEYDRLGKMAERESRVIASLATKMRLTQQTTYDKGKKKPIRTVKPWDED